MTIKCISRPARKSILSLRSKASIFMAPVTIEALSPSSQYHFRVASNVAKSLPPLPLPTGLFHTR